MSSEDGKEPAFMQAYRKDQEHTEAVLKAFDIDDFTADASEVKTAKVPYHSQILEVRFKRLDATDMTKMRTWQSLTNDDRTMQILALVLRKADGKTTFEKVMKMPLDLPAKILQAISRDLGMDFFGSAQTATSKNGSALTTKQKTSGS